MASKTKVAPQKGEVPEKEGPETLPESPLLDRSDTTVKKLIGTAKKRGYVTHAQINLLSKELNFERIEDVLAMFSEIGVNVVETEERIEDEEQREELEEEAEAGAASWSRFSARSPPNPSPRSRSSAPTTPFAYTCGKWAR